MQEHDDDEQENKNFESGWEYLKRKHLGTMILLGFVLVIVGYELLISYIPKSDPTPCSYQDSGCSEYDVNRIWP